MEGAGGPDPGKETRGEDSLNKGSGCKGGDEHLKMGFLK